MLHRNVKLDGTLTTVHCFKKRTGFILMQLEHFMSMIALAPWLEATPAAVPTCTDGLGASLSAAANQRSPARMA